MTRPLRLEFPGAVYHVTARGNRHASIFLDDADRRAWLSILGLTCERFNYSVHGYCQMTNHFHLLVETIDGALARGMRYLNGVYSQQVNRRHGLSGHLFQGRYHAVLVQKDKHLLELARYIVLNPVRAHMVDHAEQWRWSSYHATLGKIRHREWFDRTWLIEQFGSSTISAADSYRGFVDDGLVAHSPFARVKHRLVLGDETFVAATCNGTPPEAVGHAPRSQRRAAALTLADYASAFPSRDAAMAQAYRSTAFTMAEIALYFGVSSKTVSRAVNKASSPFPCAASLPSVRA